MSEAYVWASIRRPCARVHAQAFIDKMRDEKKLVMGIGHRIKSLENPVMSLYLTHISPISRLHLVMGIGHRIKSLENRKIRRSPHNPFTTSSFRWRWS